ncbi:MAG: DUF6468 domain-containing protein [Alphaproteobacteria bacterium]|nr:DUF6468 domain-containing protein [Alphaproteobacteria bacterium]
MTGLIANVLLNVILVGLLSATILYCYILNRRIQTLQDSKSELAKLLRQFDDSTVKASETIVAMQTASKKIGDNIQLKLDKANYLLDDLSFAIEKGSRLSNQIEASFAVGRARSRVEVEPQEHEAHSLHVTPDLPEDDHAKPAAKPAARRSPASIEAILEKVVSRKQQMQTAANDVKETAGSRSRAEQELIDLIRTSKG